ncbi:hypothetical protein [Companilactobacillus bobalius]|nr:hypothetical protein [Companilactobacillus bobalius]
MIETANLRNGNAYTTLDNLHATSQSQPGGGLFGINEDMVGIKKLLNK